MKQISSAAIWEFLYDCQRQHSLKMERSHSFCPLQMILNASEEDNSKRLYKESVSAACKDEVWQ